MKDFKKILYIEDDLDIQMVASMTLEKIGGFEVTAFSSGHAALENLGDFCPDILLLDVRMPEMDGPSTLKALRENFDYLSDVPVVFMTAKVQPDEIKFLQSLGAKGVIKKPFDPITLSDELLKIVKS
ncbi:response regulator [Thiomicrorhabdus sediminis]|uniref:Response regulator n=1 Tax=Thiomicrorhabdus sediminis TaxID=2580412 RepID=A0A4P9K4M0_9GAMM|nr:response regulator [Thiomicrorhabdus sediminis]QCU89905.1 response regulator [Thiomicrorhabdus sediminis]